MDPGPTPLGPPDQPDHLEVQVQDYRQALSGVHADLVSQLKSEREVLKQAHQSGDKDAIAAAQQAIDDLNVQLKANHDSLSAVHTDVKELRELRQQLIADVKSGNLDAIQQDRNAVAQQRDQVLADIQA
jgi:chromosome segregation ATPase